MFKKMILILCAYGIIFYVLETNLIGLRINKSHSLPHTVFLSTKCGELSRGKYVAFRHLDYTASIAKQILGLPGDQVEIADETVFINHSPISQFKRLSPSGKTFTPIRPQVIPEGYVYVHATHEDSFDSRYAEFGLVRTDNIDEELWPIF